MHMALLKSCTRVENVTRLSQRVKDKSTMENLLINIHICENTLSGLYQMNTNTILPSLFFLLCTMHASQKSVRSSISVFSYWDFALLPLETETREWVKSHVMPNPYRFRSGESTGEAEKKTWCTNSSTSATGQLLKLQLFISSLWFKSMDRKWTKTYRRVEMGKFGWKVFFFFFFMVIFRMS